MAYRTLDDIEESHIASLPGGADSYLPVLFERYAENGSAAALYGSLRVVCRIKGIDIPKMETQDGPLTFDKLSEILRSIGFMLAPRKL